MSFDRLLAAGGVALLLTGCGAKGPPRPPLSREPQAVRDVFVRLSGSAIEVRWSRPRQRVNGDRIEGPLTYRVLARTVERTGTAGPGSAPSAQGAGEMPGGAPAAGASGTPGASGIAGGQTPPGPAGPPTSTAPAPVNAAAARSSEDSFLKDAAVVAEVVETAAEAAGAAAAVENAKPAKPAKPEKKSDGAKRGGAGLDERSETKGARAPSGPRTAEPQYSVLLGPERFPGTRFTSVRLALAVVAVDGNGRRSRARPILEMDPVETLAPPSDLRASGTPEGVALGWRLPLAHPGSDPSGATAPVEPTGVDVYRAEIARPAPATEPGGPVPLPPGSHAVAGASPNARTTDDGGSASPRFPYKPIPGSPFAGESAVDRTAVIGTSYFYEARRVLLASGRGLRESESSGSVRIDYADVFPPGQPSLVTAVSADAEGKPAVRVAWSSPIDADVAGYRIYRAEETGAFVLAATVPSSPTEWTDSGVRRGATYRYTVAAIDAAVPPNEGERSETVEAMVAAEGA